MQPSPGWDVGHKPEEMQSETRKSNDMKAKAKTNETMFRDLLKDLDPVLIALLRERVVAICEQTAQDAKNWDPKNMFVHPDLYVMLNDVVQKHMGFGRFEQM